MLPDEGVGELPRVTEHPLGRGTAATTTRARVHAALAERGDLLLVRLDLSGEDNRGGVDVVIEHVARAAEAMTMKRAIAHAPIGSERELLHRRTDGARAELERRELFDFDGAWRNRHRAREAHAERLVGLAREMNGLP